MKQAHFQKGFYVVIPLSKNSAQQHMSLVEKSQKCPEDLSYKTQWDNFWTKKSAKIYKIFFILSYMTTFGNKKVHYALCAETFCNIFPYIFYFDQPALISWEKIFFYKKKIISTKHFFHSKERSEKNFFTKEWRLWRENQELLDKWVVYSSLNRVWPHELTCTVP